MKIVVLAGGLSTERTVSLGSGTSACRALRERGHRAILVDMFLGLESYTARLEEIFDAPDGLCGDVRTAEAEKIVAAITPVPGGVGTVTSTVVARHVIRAAQKLADRSAGR